MLARNTSDVQQQYQFRAGMRRDPAPESTTMIAAAHPMQQQQQQQQQFYPMNSTVQSQVTDLQSLELRSRRTPVKSAQYSQQHGFSTTAAHVHSQHSVERGDSQNRGGVVIIPQIKDLNQERMMLRMKSHTIHSEQSSPKLGSTSFVAAFSGAAVGASTPQDHAPNIVDQHTLTACGITSSFVRENSLQSRQEHSLMNNNNNTNQDRQQWLIGMIPPQPSSIQLNREKSRSKSREQELVQSSNLNSLELDWCRMKRDHNFDNRSLSPYQFHAPASAPFGTASQQLNGYPSLSSHQFLDSQSSAKKDQSTNSDLSFDSKRVTATNNSSSRSSRFTNSNSNGVGNGSYSSSDNTKTSNAVQQSKQKTLIKRSVPLSKINLDLVKTQSSISSRSSNHQNNSNSSSSSSSHFNQKSPKTPPLSAQLNHSSSASHQQQQPNRRQFSRTSSEFKDESAHFQNILDKYSNVHKKASHSPAATAVLNSSQLSATSSSVITPANQNNTNQCGSFAMNGSIERGNSLEFFDIKRSSFNNNNSEQQQLQQQQFQNYPTIQSTTNHHSKSVSAEREVYSFSSRTTHLQQQQPIVSSSQANNCYPTSQGTPIHHHHHHQQQQQQQQLSTQQQSQHISTQQKMHLANSSISNSIKVKSPKQNDLKSISARIPQILLKQNSSENMSSSLSDSSPAIIPLINCKSSFSSEIDCASTQSNNSTNNASSAYYRQPNSSQQSAYAADPLTPNERNVKHMIMSKISKMNVAKIFLKEDEIGSYVQQQQQQLQQQSTNLGTMQFDEDSSQQQNHVPIAPQSHQRRTSKCDSTPQLQQPNGAVFSMNGLVPSVTGLSSSQIIPPQQQTGRLQNSSATPNTKSQLTTHTQQLLLTAAAGQLRSSQIESTRPLFELAPQTTSTDLNRNNSLNRGGKGLCTFDNTYGNVAVKENQFNNSQQNIDSSRVPHAITDNKKTILSQRAQPVQTHSTPAIPMLSSSNQNSNYIQQQLQTQSQQQQQQQVQQNSIPLAYQRINPLQASQNVNRLVFVGNTSKNEVNQLKQQQPYNPTGSFIGSQKQQDSCYSQQQISATANGSAANVMHNDEQYPQLRSMSPVGGNAQAKSQINKQPIGMTQPSQQYYSNPSVQQQPDTFNKANAVQNNPKQQLRTSNLVPSNSSSSNYGGSNQQKQLPNTFGQNGGKYSSPPPMIANKIHVASESSSNYTQQQQQQSRIGGKSNVVVVGNNNGESGATSKLKKIGSFFGL